MSTSPLGYFARANTAHWAAAQVTVSETASRRIVLNNLCHAADEHAQRRVAFSVPTSGVTGGQGYLEIDSSPTADVYYRSACLGTWPIPIRQSGQSYRMRVRLGGISSNGHQVTFSLVVFPANRDPRDALVGSYDHRWTATTTSTTPGWRTGASAGASGWANMIELSADLVASGITRTSTLTDVSGTPTGVQQCLVSCYVFGLTSNAASLPRLYGVVVDDWIGT